MVKKRELQKARNIIIYVFRIQWNVDKYTTKNFIKYYEYGEFLNFAKQKDSCLCHVPIEYITAKLYSAAALISPEAMECASHSIWNEEFAMEVATLMGSVSDIPEEFATREVHKAIAIKNYIHILRIPPDIFDQEFCNELVDNNAYLINYIPDEYLTQEMCDKVAYEVSLNNLHIPPAFISEKIAIANIAMGYSMYLLPKSAITHVIRKIMAYCSPDNVLRFERSQRDEKIIEVAIYGNCNIFHKCTPLEITEKLAMLFIVCDGIYQKDLPRAFHTTDFVLRMVEKYKINIRLIIPQCINEDVKREMLKNVDKKQRRKHIVRNSYSVKFAEYYFAGDNLECNVLEFLLNARSEL